MNLNKEKIIQLLTALGKKLDANGKRGEIGIVGGTAMCLLFENRTPTKDVDAVFKPSLEIRTAAKEIAEENGLPEYWLNDAVKGYLKKDPSKNTVLDVPGLTVWLPELQYLLAMKAISARFDSHDATDLKTLIKHLNLKSVQNVLDIVEKYYPANHTPAKTQFFIEEIFGSKHFK